jgi:hypothetical protein
MSNNYKVYSTEGKLIREVRGAACFSGLREHHTKNKDIYYVYELKSKFTKAQITKWHALCNDWCLVAEQVNDKEFRIGPREFYHALIAPAVARRYLEEYGITDIASKTFKFIEKYPKEDTLDLFQLAHYYTSELYNFNHTFLSRDVSSWDQSYDYSFRRLVTRDDIYKNLNKQIAPRGRVGLNRIFRRDEDPLTSIGRKRFKLPKNPLEFLKILKK